MDKPSQLEYYEGFNLAELTTSQADPYIILIHHNDVDGIVSKFNIQRRFNVSESIPADYNKSMAFNTNRYASILHTRPKIAFVVDFCLKENEYDLLIKHGFKIIVIDHHSDGRINVLKQTKYQNDINYLFSDQFSASILTAYFIIYFQHGSDAPLINKNLVGVLTTVQLYTNAVLYMFLLLVDARDRGVKSVCNDPTYLHTYFKSHKFAEDKIFEVYSNKVCLNDALDIGNKLYSKEFADIAEEIRKSNWSVVRVACLDGQDYVPRLKLLHLTSEISINATNALAVANQMQSQYNHPPIDGVLVEYYSERLSQQHNDVVCHVEIRMNDHNTVHMGEFLKDICDISGGGHMNAAGGDLFATTLDAVFK